MTTDRTIPDFQPSTHFFEKRAERTNQRYRAQLLDEDGNPVNPAAITSIKLTIWDGDETVVPAVDNIVNSRNGSEIYSGPTEATVDADGWLSFRFTAADMAVTGSETEYLRRAHFRIVFSGGEINHEITFPVRNLGGVS